MQNAGKWPTIDRPKPKYLLSVALLMLLIVPMRAQIAIDAKVFADLGTQKSSVSTSPFSTSSGNELLLAFVATDSVGSANVTVQTVSGAGLAWTLVVRSNAQKGTAEIWRAFAATSMSNVAVTATLSQSVTSSITVMSFTGVDTSGTNGSGAIGATTSKSAASGAPTATLVTNGNNSWVFGVGNDWDNAIQRTPGAGQNLLHQYLATVGDTYWVQGQSAPTALSGTSVTINDTAPTADRYNLSIVEVLAGLSSTAPDLTITKTHSGTFVQGQTGAIYTIIVSNNGGAATSGTVTMTDALPPGLTASAISGTGWVCSLATLTCTRSDTLAGAASYPAITVTVNVANNAAASVTNTATVSGGGETNISNDTANDTTAITSPPDLSITKTHSGSFIQGQTGATYTITVTNSGGAATSGTVNVSDTLPAALTATAIGGTGWTCTLASFTCTRSNALAAGTSYPAITLTVNVASNAPASVTNTAMVSGGGEINTANDTANDVTAITVNALPDLTVTKGHSDNFVQGQTGASYTITVTNSGGAATSGTVTMTDTLPAALTSTALSGTGWTCVLTALTCTRSDALAAAASYPAITLTVNVANNVPASVTNIATVSGGSETNITNNTASDLTSIATSNLTSIKRIQSNVNGNEGGTSNMSVSFTSANTGGNFLIVTGSAARPATMLAISDTLGNVYLPAFGPVTDPNQDVTIYIWYVPVCKGGSNTVTITPSVTAALEIHVSEWSGLATTSPVDQIASATGTGSAASSGSQTTTANGELIFGYGWVLNTASAGAGFTPISLVNGDLDEYQIQNAAGSVAATFTQSSGAWFALMATFKPASSPGTWSISGNISPTAGGSGAIVGLTGPANSAVTADASGNYTFSGLPNGNYTVTPSNGGYTFIPPSAPVTINGANPPPINFTAQTLGSTWTITGTISPSAGGSGSTLAVSGSANFNVVADANGNYTASQLANGTYTITPSKNGYTFNPPSQNVPIIGTSVSGVNFTAVAPSNSITLDTNTSANGLTAGSTIVSPAFSTSASNELLLALIATDYLGGANTTVAGVSGGGLAWTLVVRTNAQSGSSEIWRAVAATPLSNATVTATLSQSVVSSITVMSFMGVNTSGTNGSGAIGATASKSASTGAPTATLITKGNNSWVLGVGNDFDNAITRTLGSGQSLIHQYLTPTGDTYWSQMLTNPVPASGTTVTINDTAPTTDRYNLSIVEILAGSGGISDTTPPTVSVTSPTPGTTIASLETVSAIAADNIAVAGVQFLLDGAPLGAELTTQPYSIVWDTSTAAAGSHTLAARARDEVGLTTTSTPVTITVDNSGNPAVVGSWSSVVSLPAVAVNLILLQNSSVLFYQDGTTPTVWNYQNNAFTNIPAPADLFCSGHALLADGRILMVGGYGGSSNSFGIAKAEIFDPFSKTWTSVPNMAYKRWYPNATTLSDGRILVTAGWQTSAHSNAGISEIYNPTANTWTQLTNANNPFETYPFMYLLPDGRIIHIGGTEYPTDTDILDLSTNTWSVVDPNVVDGGSATMYALGKFMKAGSAADSQNVGPSSNTTFVLDMTQASPSWRQTASMVYPRSFFNLTTLPDGSVLATGGETDKDGGNIANAVYAAELWSPKTQTWSTMASMHTPREYHGTALLLPDGRVLVSGMGADGGVPDQKSAEFYSPPYLFKGPRPTITQAPAQIQNGSNFFVGTPDAGTIASVSLIRTGAVTHFFDQNARSVPLSFTQTNGGLTVTAPANANLAPPGYYLLFVVNSAGVPSIAPFVQVQ